MIDATKVVVKIAEVAQLVADTVAWMPLWLVVGLVVAWICAVALTLALCALAARADRMRAAAFGDLRLRRTSAQGQRAPRGAPPAW